MNDRCYFLLGDSLTNIVIGAFSALLCVTLIDTDWNMVLAMLVGMPLGMLLALILGLLVFFRYFGANEVMVPSMLTGMTAGMLVSMLAAMQPTSYSKAAVLGAITGLVVLAFCYYSDYLIRANRKDGE